MLDLPFYIPIIFILGALFCVAMLIFAFRQKASFTVVLSLAVALLIFMGVQAALSLRGFFLNFEAVPPPFLLAVVPSLLAILVAFLLPSRKLLFQLPMQILIWIHVVRIPVELGLWQLYHEAYLPKLMTFEGGNLDILAGITAIGMALWAFRSELKTRALLIWNVASLLLLINIIVRAALAAPYVTQQIAFSQPNIGVLYFPMIWLPSIIVPIVLFTHLVSIGQLILKLRTSDLKVVTT